MDKFIENENYISSMEILPDDINVIGNKSKALKLGKDVKYTDYPSMSKQLYFDECKVNGDLYIDYIYSKGYSLCIDDICDAFDLTENYVQRYIIKYIDRIELTTSARYGLKNMCDLEDDLYKNYIHLFDKKILMNRDSLLNYLNNNMIKLSDCIAFQYKDSDFADITKFSFKEIKSRIKEKISKLKLDIKYNHTYSINCLEKNFQSIDNMKIRLGFRHNVQIYRIIEMYSYSKFILNCNTVRYLLDDSDIKKIINDNRENIYYRTIDNSEYIGNTSTQDEPNTPTNKDQYVYLQIEKYILSHLLENLDYENDYESIKILLLDIIKKEYLI